LKEDQPESEHDGAEGPISISELIDLSVKVGYFSPSDEDLSELYGGGLAFGGELFIWSNSGFGGGITIERFGKSGDMYISDPYGALSESKAEMSVLPIAFTVAYRMPKITPDTKVRPFFGAGVGVYMLNEDSEAILTDGSSHHASVSKRHTGFHASGGIQVEMSPSASFLLEVKFSRTSASGESEVVYFGETWPFTTTITYTDVNLGGFNIFAGVRF